VHLHPVVRAFAAIQAQADLSVDLDFRQCQTLPVTALAVIEPKPGNDGIWLIKAVGSRLSLRSVERSSLGRTPCADYIAAPIGRASPKGLPLESANESRSMVQRAGGADSRASHYMSVDSALFPHWHDPAGPERSGYRHRLQHVRGK